jgi:hypothetical protein
MNYKLLIALDVVEFVERLPSRFRKSIRSTFASIGEDPLGTLMYWIDGADQHVKILDIIRQTAEPLFFRQNEISSTGA